MNHCSNLEIKKAHLYTKRDTPRRHGADLHVPQASKILP